MANSLKRICFRLDHEPQSLLNSKENAKTRAKHRREKDKEEREKHRLRRVDTYGAANRDKSIRYQHNQGIPAAILSERPRLTLEMCEDLPGSTHLGMPLEFSVVVSLEPSSLYGGFYRSSKWNPSSLFAVASLVADRSPGERTPLGAPSLTGQKMLDSVHPMDEGRRNMVLQNPQYRYSIGYADFNILVRQAGLYRIRITLFQMSDDLAIGATSLTFIDSQPVHIQPVYIEARCPELQLRY